MIEDDSSERRWEEMEIDILVRIFKTFNIIELTSGISRVCSTWRLACSDPMLWKTLDLGLLRSNYIKIPAAPFVWVSDSSDKRLMRLLKVALGLSRGSLTCLIFHFHLYLKDEHLIYTAERCPRLKRLVLPAWNRITKGGICKAVRIWEDLESLTMPSIAYPPYIMEEIGKSCKNFTELKLMGSCDVLFASTLATWLPKLKVLSLRCSMLTMEALILILDSLMDLEVLNISHCLLLEVPEPPAPKRVLRELDETVIEKASRLREFYTCQEDSCLMCQRMKDDEGIIRWYKYEEWSWRMDEVSCLSLAMEQHVEVGGGSIVLS
ncbi:F-box/LRR-repeat protein At3g48880-like [Telopea speciosissima]|uniref:F-box/LRR-repeat protein At3g48880-like n=1 Tax=Telopea speciosissima TaxID=54955 RepID=UPI001CC405D7|nr:F-box/LRR-repeat protein At3g48880-like [Telopea speciosissima]XP_043698106.1 F-box/LRR-repeat protein At3g48880-like [Telopea speciosissima]